MDEKQEKKYSGIEAWLTENSVDLEVQALEKKLKAQMEAVVYQDGNKYAIPTQNELVNYDVMSTFNPMTNCIEITIRTKGKDQTYSSRFLYDISVFEEVIQNETSIKEVVEVSKKKKEPIDTRSRVQKILDLRAQEK